ncbi:addiction module protein [Lignipirellula cremea]|uniref:Addiction module component n=1 Tax=Lignipirellula cremea TaxID=2528010 RepID=A0A518E3D1_9BACT|nr:addiction module protein [Lignipirellula cremea]QDU98597.1 Putative addiction module component [Lignipirellula cremea]
MTEQTEKLIAEALQLSAEERAAIIDALLTSDPLIDVDHGPEDPPEEVEAAWRQELQRRSDDLKTGRVQGVPADEVLARMTKRDA